jgi:hypothetical protein
MRQFCLSCAFLGKFLLGVLICSTAWAARIEHIKSLDQFEQAIKSAGYGSASVIIVFEPDNFENPKEAKQIEDAIALARTWNVWFCKDGRVVINLREKMNFAVARQVRAKIDNRTRADLTFEWLWERVEAVPYLSHEVLQALDAQIPSQLAAIKPAVSFVLEAKRSGNMRRTYPNPRARTHAFRQKNLGLRVVSCEADVANASPAGDL